jgi:hypothetical protein
MIDNSLMEKVKLAQLGSFESVIYWSVYSPLGLLSYKNWSQINDRERASCSMRKWLAGILATIIGGSALWFLTNEWFPQVMRSSPTPVPAEVRVECSPNPGTVAPGGTTELTVRVTFNGSPVEGAVVRFRPEEGGATTVSGGILRTTWTAPNPSASGYIFPVYADLRGIRTPTGELYGNAKTDCQVLVR